MASPWPSSARLTTSSPCRQLDAAHAGGFAALEDADVRDGEADALAGARGQQHVVVLGAELDADDAVALRQLHGDLAGLVDVGEVRQLVAAHVAGLGGEHHLELVPARLVLRQRQDGGDALALLQRQQIHHRLAAALDARFRQAPDLEPVDHAGGGEEQQRRVRVGDEDMRDEILFVRRHAGAAFAAAALHAVLGERRALDVAAMRDGDGHVLALDQVFVFDFDVGVDDLGPARRGEFVPDRRQLVLDDREHARPRAQDVEIVGDRDARASSPRRRSR